MSPLSGGTSHMATESLVAALQGTDYDTGLDLKQLNVVRAYFAKLREKYIANGRSAPSLWAWTPTPCCIRCRAACSPTCSSS